MVATIEDNYPVQKVKLLDKQQTLDLAWRGAARLGMVEKKHGQSLENREQVLASLNRLLPRRLARTVDSDLAMAMIYASSGKSEFLIEPKDDLMEETATDNLIYQEETVQSCIDCYLSMLSQRRPEAAMAVEIALGRLQKKGKPTMEETELKWPGDGSD